MKRAPRSHQHHDLYRKYHDHDSEISELLGECGLRARFRYLHPAISQVRPVGRTLMRWRDACKRILSFGGSRPSFRSGPGEKILAEKVLGHHNKLTFRADCVYACCVVKLSRAVAAGGPLHVTQRDNRRQPTFFDDADYQLYRGLLAQWRVRCDVAVWTGCLMPNHVRLLLIPADGAGLRRALSETRRRYTRAVNRRQGWVGDLWQGRFASCLLDPPRVLAAARYIELTRCGRGSRRHPRRGPGAALARIRTAVTTGSPRRLRCSMRLGTGGRSWPVA